MVGEVKGGIRGEDVKEGEDGKKKGESWGDVFLREMDWKGRVRGWVKVGVGVEKRGEGKRLREKLRRRVKMLKRVVVMEMMKRVVVMEIERERERRERG
jgi:hypothetical protein